jgi:hypothetical protein
LLFYLLFGFTGPLVVHGGFQVVNGVLLFYCGICQRTVQILEDLPHYLHKVQRSKYPDIASATCAVQGIRESIHAITKDVFAAYENEYSIFCPMSGCFELYGLDFMVDEDLGVHFLEANPGPDFKQTGSRLQGLIAQLWEQTCKIVVDSGMMLPSLAPAAAVCADNSISADMTHEQVDRCLGPQWRSEAPDFTLVYSKEWSAAKLQGGMSFIDESK